jgi:putative transposase
MRIANLELQPVPERFTGGWEVGPKTDKYATDKLREGPAVWSSREPRRGIKMPKKGLSENRFCGRCTSRERRTGSGYLSRARGSEATFYVWKKKCAGPGLSELRELRQLREETGKLKRLAADLLVDRHILQEIVRKKL